MTVDGKYLCVGLGEILWDMLPGGKQLGGAPANFAYHSQALGAQGVVVSCIGEDELGREIITRLDELGLDRLYLAVDKTHPTGTVTVELDQSGKPDYTIHQNGYSYQDKDGTELRIGRVSVNYTDIEGGGDNLRRIQGIRQGGIPPGDRTA